MLFTFQRPAQCDVSGTTFMDASGNTLTKDDVTWFYLDGRPVPLASSNDPNEIWPTEITADSRLIEMSMERLEGEIGGFENEILGLLNSITAGAGIRYGNHPPLTHNPATVLAREPVALLMDGSDPNVYVAQSQAGSPPPFQGLIDNIVFDSLWIRKADGGGNLKEVKDSYLSRYDCYRPSTTDNAANSSAYNSSETGLDSIHTKGCVVVPLVFRKHTPAVEWDRPVRIVSYDVTAWKTQDKGTGVEAAGDTDSEGQVHADSAGNLLGHVYLRMGWLKAQPGSQSAPTGSVDWSAPPWFVPPDGTPVNAANGGWTPRLTTLPYNAFTAGRVVPDRDGTTIGGGFLAWGGGAETYNYAIEILATGDTLLSGPRMAPVIDDVTVTYMPWDTAIVIEEEEVVE
jgi:hypothetical protein